MSERDRRPSGACARTGARGSGDGPVAPGQRGRGDPRRVDPPERGLLARVRRGGAAVQLLLGSARSRPRSAAHPTGTTAHTPGRICRFFYGRLASDFDVVCSLYGRLPGVDPNVIEEQMLGRSRGLERPRTSRTAAAPRGDQDVLDRGSPSRHRPATGAANQRMVEPSITSLSPMPMRAPRRSHCSMKPATACATTSGSRSRSARSNPASWSSSSAPPLAPAQRRGRHRAGPVWRGRHRRSADDGIPLGSGVRPRTRSNDSSGCTGTTRPTKASSRPCPGARTPVRSMACSPHTERWRLPMARSSGCALEPRHLGSHVAGCSTIAPARGARAFASCSASHAATPSCARKARC